MSDATLLESLNAALVIHRMKMEEQRTIVATLEGTISTLYPAKTNPPPTAKREAPVHKSKVQRAFANGRNATRITDEQVVDAAIGLLRKGGPLTLTVITKGIKKAYPKVKGGIGVALRAEEKKTGGRLARNADGKWDEKTTAKRVDVKRTPEEIAAAFAKAKDNEDRQTEAA